MNKQDISLSTLVEEVVCELVTRKPELKASFEINNNVVVRGSYRRWKNAVQNLIEFIVNAKKNEYPTVIFKKMESENVYMVMDNGKHFHIVPENLILTISIVTPINVDESFVKRIIIRQGGHFWTAYHDARFFFSFN
jgi:light-regulated signal transduction histidine kinase (bacteriophytochrome)